MGSEERRHTSSFHRRHRDSKHRDDRKRKHKSEKSRERRRHRHRSRSPAEEDDAERLLEKGRMAMKALRELLGYQYDLKDEMKELIRHLDAGKRLDVSAIPDAYVLAKVCQVFDNISLIHTSRDGTYKSKYPDASIMSLLEPVLEEKREDLESVYKESVGVVNPEVKEKQQRRPAGPMMPSEEERRRASIKLEDLAENDLGPAPGPSLPEFPDEELEESSDAKLQAIGRILKVLENHKSKRLLGENKAAIPPNPYHVLDIEKSASSSEIKKKFLRLSLMIHPDKCDHPSAPTAFDAVSTAAKRLQDPDERIVANKEVEDIEHMEISRALEKEKEREVAWKIARGEMTKEDIVPARREREAWMTSVPTTGPLSHMKSQTQFKSRAAPAHDESWIRAPGQQHSVGPQPRVAGPSQEVQEQHEDVLPSRPKSLLEKHTDALNASNRNARTQHDLVNSSGAEYKPFNRETDLEIKKSVDADDLMKNLKSLHGRFGRGSM
jgi:curved DNA-binding protein CbpA